MSKWTDVRDSVVEALKVEAVGQSMKNDFITWLTGEGIEFAQAFTDRVIAECKADAPKETGWCKIRDGLVLPIALNIGMYILKTVLTKSAAETK